MIMEPEPLRALIFEGLDQNQVPIKNVLFSCQVFTLDRRNQHVIVDHKRSVARSEW